MSRASQCLFLERHTSKNTLMFVFMRKPTRRFGKSTVTFFGQSNLTKRDERWAMYPPPFVAEVSYPYIKFFWCT